MKVLFAQGLPRLLVLAFVLASPLFAADTDGRFTHALTVEELQETGIARLSSDHAGVLDALVRRDLTARINRDSDEASKSFSDRLTADERRIAGLNDLSDAELARLNSLVERFQTVAVSRTLLSPPVLVSRHADVRPREGKAGERKIHGSFSFGMGWGSNGYSERTGAMELHTELKPGLHLGVGYSVSRVKGDGPYYYRESPSIYVQRTPPGAAPVPPAPPPPSP